MKKRSKSSQPTPQTGEAPQTGETQTVVQERPAHIDSGNEARGSTNARTNQTRTQPEPDAATRALGAVKALGPEADPFKVIALRPKGRAPSLLTEASVELSETMAEKSKLESEARQSLAHAIELFGEGADKEGEALLEVESAAIKIYDLRVRNLISADVVTGILGDQFGFKHKDNKDEAVPAGHPSASKTPFKRGEAIRKRIVRAVQAHEYIEGRDGGKFFDGLPKSDISGILNGMIEGKIGFWNAYERFAEVKREHDAQRAKIDPAFDPKRVASMAEKLNEEGAAKTLLDNPELVNAYVTLVAMVELACEKAAGLRKAA